MNAVIDIKEPVVVAFENVFGDDRWEQIVGCNRCGKCCGRCKMKLPSGDCRLHIEDSGQKPIRCIATPTPDVVLSYCAIQFKCVKGERAGETIKVCGK